VTAPRSPIEPFALERFFARWEFKAPYLLCTSDIEGMALAEVLTLADDETRSLWENLTLGYTESLGHPLLRAEIAGLYETVDSDDVLCFSGAEEAIYIFMRVLLRPGDHVIVTFPGYQSSYQVAETIGAEVSHWNLRPFVDGDGKTTWSADINGLRSLIRPNTKLILVNFPHNPTGALPSHAEWEEIVAIARDAGCYLFSDEVYRLLEYHPEDRLPAAVDQLEKGLSLGVMSKPFGLAGLRIGWLAVKDHNLLAQLASYKDYTTICNSAPSEILALIALRSKEAVLERSLGIIRRNLAIVETALQEMSRFFDWIPPRAGSIAFPRWKGELPVDKFAETLILEEGVLLLPGTVYQMPGGYFRLGLGRTNTSESLDRLARFVSKL
jgi:aspartate/methionine/tyrosine aminotransferase